MIKETIQSWTATEVALSAEVHCDVKYQVYRKGDTNFLDMRNADDRPIHTLELPDGMILDKSSYEVLLRYVLLDVVAA